MKTKNNYEEIKLCIPARHVHIHGGGKSLAHDIEVANADGVTIYYNFTNDQTELEVTYQGSSLFNAAYSGNVVIPESVTYEGNTYSVTSIGYAAFFYCKGLTDVTIPGSVTSIGRSAFDSCSSLTEVTIPGSVTSIGYSAFSGCSGLTEVTIPNSVTSIGDDVFYVCSGLTEVTIPNSVTSIGDTAFGGCSGLIEVTIPNSVTSIGMGAFVGCSSLTEVTIGNSVTSIGDEAFSRCSSLTSVTIPNSVTSIGDYAFYYCSGLTELTIGNSVTSIGKHAFIFCSRLTPLYSLSTTPPSVSNTDAFDYYHYTDVDLFVPAEALAAYQTEVWKDFQKLQGFDPTAIAKVTAAEQIQTANGQVTVTGLTDGTTVAVYDLSGRQVGTATSKGGQATVNTGMTAGAAAIVKVGERSVKTVMK